MTQDFADFEIDQEPEVKGKGIVCVVSRTSANGKILIKSHAVQTSFFALPLNPTKADLKKVDEKVKDIAASYEANKYKVDRYDFNLPFEVEAICRVTKGYTPTAKPLKAEDVKKKRKIADADEDADEDADKAPKSKKRALADEPTAKRAKKAA